MQGPLVRVAGSQHQEDRMVARGGREVAPFGQVDADPVEDHRPNYWSHCGSMSGEIRIFAVSVIIQFSENIDDNIF